MNLEATIRYINVTDIAATFDERNHGFVDVLLGLRLYIFWPDVTSHPGSLEWAK